MILINRKRFDGFKYHVKLRKRLWLPFLELFIEYEYESASEKYIRYRIFFPNGEQSRLHLLYKSLIKGNPESRMLRMFDRASQSHRFK